VKETKDHVNPMNSTQKPVAAIILSSLSGIFIILGSVICSFWWNASRPLSWMEGMMPGWEESMHQWNIGNFAFFITLLGIVFGAVIIVSAMALYTNPKQHQLWGTWILSLSVISIITCMGGMGIGLVLGIIGGILAILWKPEESM
jgi:hypothetical protein